jgi:cell division transport system permease protein
MALGLLQLALAYLSSPLESLLSAYGNSFAVQGVGAGYGAAFLVTGGTLGLLGSWLSVGRHLRQFRLEEMPRRR